MYIYKIDIPATGQCYIGQTTKSIQFRFGQHKNSNASSLIARAIQHWGNPIITQLHKASSKNELNRLETEEIKARNTIFPFGYNLSLGGAYEKARHKDNPDWQYEPDDSDINLPATINESKRGFRTLITELIQKQIISEDEYNEIADDFGISPITRRMEHKMVRITNNIWTGKVEKIVNSMGGGTWSTDWPIRLQQGPVTQKEMLEMMENSGVNYVNVWRHKAHNEAQRKLCNKIHAQVAENKLLLAVGETK
jgi:hypothetical protein